MSDQAGSDNKELIRKIQQLEADIESLRTFENIPYRAIVEDMSEFIVRWKPGGLRLFVNDAYCKLFNATREELIGTSFITLINDEDQSHVNERLGALTPDNPISFGSHRAVGPNGETIWMEWSDRAIFDTDRNIIEYQSVGRDITERVLAHEKLRRIEKAEAVSRATFEIAHDLNNVFTIIAGHLELLKEGKPGSLQSMESGLDKGIKLLEQLRELRYGYQWNPMTINLNEKIAEDQGLLVQLSEATPISLALTSRPCFIDGDPVQIDQLLCNLIRNAGQASAGKGKIGLSLDLLPTIDLETHHDWPADKPASCCVLRVSDEAGGIPEAIRSSMFDQHISTKPEGQGLGLRTVKSIVDTHGASIYYNTSNVGTTFEIAFPAL